MNLSGWALQYGGNTDVWGVMALPAQNLAAGQYLLIQGGVHRSGTPLPTPDVTGGPTLGPSGTLALTSNTTPLSGFCPTRTAALRDFVGYGTPAPCFEGDGPTATINEVTSIQRKNEGCTDSDDNANDFPGTPPPEPRNSSTTAGGLLGAAADHEPDDDRHAAARQHAHLHGRDLERLAGQLRVPLRAQHQRRGLAADRGRRPDTTWQVEEAYVGERVACEEIAFKDPFTPAIARSNSKMAAAGVPMNTAMPSISGTPIVGQTISAPTATGRTSRSRSRGSGCATAARSPGRPADSTW